VGLERGPLSLVSTTEELFDRKVAAPVGRYSSLAVSDHGVLYYYLYSFKFNQLDLRFLIFGVSRTVQIIPQRVICGDHVEDQ
jgi:hypothetical protein